MIIRKIKIFCFVLLLILFGYGVLSFGDASSVSAVSSEATSSEEYFVIKGKKPADAEIFGYLRSSDTNEICLQENWLSGTKYLSSYDDKLKLITYSDNGDSYVIKVPIVPEYSSKECDTKVDVVQVAAKSPGADIRYAELQIRIAEPNKFRLRLNINEDFYVKSVCGAVFMRNKEWSQSFFCDYSNKDRLIEEMENNSSDVVLSPDLFKAGTVITYDIIPGENYFPTLERPE